MMKEKIMKEFWELFCKWLISEIDILNKDYYYYFYSAPTSPADPFRTKEKGVPLKKLPLET